MMNKDLTELEIKAIRELSPITMQSKVTENFKMSFWGGVVADIMGSFFEFKKPADIKSEDVNFYDIALRENNVFGHEFGYFTDDTIFMLSAIESFASYKVLDTNDQMYRMGLYIEEGKWTRDGRCFDIGISTKESYDEWNMRKKYTSRRDDRLGNGALMKIAPYVYWYIARVNAGQDIDLYKYCERVVLMTHGMQAVETFYDTAVFLIRKWCFSNVQIPSEYIVNDVFEVNACGYHKDSAKIAFTLYDSYVGDSCDSGSDAYEYAVCNAIELGYDTDTNACITGQLIGYNGKVSFVKYIDEINDLLGKFIHVAQERYSRIA